MAKEHITKFNTAHFVITNSADAYKRHPSSAPFEIRRRITKKNRGANIDPKALVMSISYTQPDKFRSSVMTLDLREHITAEEFNEILEAVNSTMCTNEEMEFVSIAAGELEADESLSDAFRMKTSTYETDPLDPSYYVWKKPIADWGGIYMLLGLSVGMSISRPTGMCVGMAIGLAIGTALKASMKNKQNKLWEGRIAAGSTEEV